MYKISITLAVFFLFILTSCITTKTATTEFKYLGELKKCEGEPADYKTDEEPLEPVPFPSDSLR